MREHEQEIRCFGHLYLAQILMDELHGYRSFADSGGNSLH